MQQSFEFFVDDRDPEPPVTLWQRLPAEERAVVVAALAKLIAKTLTEEGKINE